MFLALVGAWAALAPTPVGGATSYVIVNGNSMEPAMSLGDLAVVREAGAEGYGPGDVVAYEHPQIGPVIHRIIGREDGQFVLQGDNNSWVDSYRPSDSEIIGKLWIEVPALGRLFGWLRNPASMAVLVAIMGVIAMNSFDTATTNRNGSGRDNRSPWRRRLSHYYRAGSAGSPASSPPTEPPTEPSTDGRAGFFGGEPSGGPARGRSRGMFSENADGAITFLAALLLASVLLGFFAFTRPASVPVSDEAAYQHTGEFSYSADAPEGIYDSGEAATGQPVFPRVSDEVEVRFNYRLDSDLPASDVEGTYRMVARVSDESGWSRTIPLEPETPFSGDSFTAVAILDLEEIKKLTDRVERQTGAEASRHAISVVPEISTRGSLAGQPLEDEFSPSLDFWLDSLRLQLQTPVSAATGGSPDSLEPSKEGALEGSTAELTEPNTLPVLFFDLGVGFARALSVAGLVISAAGLALVGVPRLRALRSDEPTRIRARYGPLLVSISRSGEVSAQTGSEERLPRIEVSAFEDLVKIAESAGQSILHRPNGALHEYYVHDLGAIYYYAASETDPAVPAGAPSVPEDR